MDIIHAFAKRINKSGLIEPADRILVGVSGGVDSVVLLDILKKISEELALIIDIAHVNYGLRGKESDRDEKFVAGLAKRYSCRLHIARPGKIGKSKNIQSLARDIRYDFFLKIARKIGAKKIALAHHADDQAETVLFHLIRGSGLGGLTGMADRREIEDGIFIVRPLLPFFRTDIEKYAKSAELKHVEDSSNKTKKYSRNVIRQDILPLISKINPSSVAHICETTGLLSEENSALEEIAEDALKKGTIPIQKGDCPLLKLDRQKFIELHLAIQRRVLRIAYKNVRGDTKDLLSDHIEKMILVANSTKPAGRYSLPNGIAFERHGDEMTIRGS